MGAALRADSLAFAVWLPCGTEWDMVDFDWPCVRADFSAPSPSEEPSGCPGSAHRGGTSLLAGAAFLVARRQTVDDHDVRGAVQKYDA